MSRLIVDIPDLLKRLGIEATQKGEHWWARCPYHDDKKPSWRIRDQVEHANHGANHCLARETRVITFDGVRAIGGLAGTTQRLLTSKSEWVDAQVRSFGVQPLLRVVLSRNGIGKEIFATPEHRWLLRGESVARTLIERTTVELRSGHKLAWSYPQNALKGIAAISAYGIAHGLVFGDGTLTSAGARLDLHGEKNKQLVKWFPLSRTRDREDGGIEVLDLPRAFKSRPSLDESRSYLAGWLAGYLAADGHISKTGVCQINSARREDLEFVRDVCTRIGIGTFAITTQMRVGIGQVEPSALHRVILITEDLNEQMFLIAEHRRRFTELKPRAWNRRGWVVRSVELTERVEEVFCAVVPGTHSFALEDNILTGNCFACEGGGSAVWLAMQVLGLEVRDALAWIKSGKAASAPLKLRVEVDVQRTDVFKFRLPAGAKTPPLDRWPAIAREYAEKRHITPMQIERWGLGYALEGRLRGRLVIPIRDGFGQLLSYTARTWGDANRRYLEPHTDERADKGAVFGEEHWRSDRTTIIVSEGALNALAIERALDGTCERAEIGALEGSQLANGHTLRVGTFANVVIAADPDKAGDKLRAMLRGLGRWCKLWRMQFPTGHDACDVEQKYGLRALTDLIANREPMQ